MNKIGILFLAFLIVLASSCRSKPGGEAQPAGESGPAPKVSINTQQAAPAGSAETSLRRDPLKGGPFPSLLITQSRFLPADDGSGKNTKPGPARLIILRKNGAAWKQVIVDDSDSNVFHKAAQLGGAILTAGATVARLKLWTFKEGVWSAEVLWNPKFGGKFDRLRDFEIGKVMPGGEPQITVATHDQGVVAVVSRTGGKWNVMEIDKQPDTFVHEIELADFDGDGLNEIYATPSMPNKVGVSQSGEVTRYRWNGKSFDKTVVKKFETRHVKEILATTLLGDGRPSLFAVAEAELETIGGKTKIKTPVEIIKFTFDASGKASEEIVASIFDSQCRFLLAGDVDGNGRTEIVAAAMKSGLWLLRPGGALPWPAENFDKNSSGFEHAACLADLDDNGKPEIYVAADDQKSLDRYAWNGSGFDKATVMPLENSVITWNITSGSL
jgi:hypothetical protein